MNIDFANLQLQYQTYKEKIDSKIVLESIFFTLVFVGITIYISSLIIN